MAYDGHLMEDVLRQGSGDADETAAQRAAMVMATRKHGGDLEALRTRLSRPRALVNQAAVLEWPRRRLKILEVIARLQPDVVTFQELDRMGDLQAALRDLGYSCGDAAYTPHHRREEPMDDEALLTRLRVAGLAFAPNLGSTCRALGLKRVEGGGDGEAYDEPDDDGCAIFWRIASFARAQPPEFLLHPPGLPKRIAAVRVVLERRTDGARLCVTCSHLKSGESPKDEEKRLHQVCGTAAGGSAGGERAAIGLARWFAESAAATPAILCLDANSSPDRKEERTVWRALRALDGVASVWDHHFRPDGTRVGGPLVMTTNKMRGPLTNQAKKMGEHACGVIDHVFMHGLSAPPSGRMHVWGPMHFDSLEQARNQLIPSIAIPSDHFPVAVELCLARPAPRASRGLAKLLSGTGAPLVAAALALSAVLLPMMLGGRPRSASSR
jgi:endonuclease/exonuclease/phosphatase family metal-dependent hydrolase